MSMVRIQPDEQTKSCHVWSMVREGCILYLAMSGCIQWRRVLKVPLLGMLIQAWLWITLSQIWLRRMRCLTLRLQCRHSWPSLLQYWGVKSRGTSHLILRACDLWSLESLIGGKGGDWSTSFSSRAWGPTASRNLNGRETYIESMKWLMFYGLPGFASRLPQRCESNTKPGDLVSPKSWGPFIQYNLKCGRAHMNRMCVSKWSLLEILAANNSTLYLKACDHTIQFQNFIDTAFRWISRALTISCSQPLAIV